MYLKSLEWCLRSKLLNKWYFFFNNGCQHNHTSNDSTLQNCRSRAPHPAPSCKVTTSGSRQTWEPAPLAFLLSVIEISPCFIAQDSGAHFCCVNCWELPLKTKLLSILRPTFSHHCYQIIILKINPQEHMCLPSVILCGVWLFIKHAVVVHLRSHVWLLLTP